MCGCRDDSVLDLRTGARHVLGKTVLFQQIFDIAEPALIDRLHRRPRRGIDGRPGADRIFQRQPLGKHPAQQERKCVGAFCCSLDV